MARYFIINGSGESGKDTFVDFIAKDLHWEDYVKDGVVKTFNIENISTIDPIRDSFSDYLGIDIWHAIVGGSMGGMQAMQWSIDYPSRLKKCVVIASTPNSALSCTRCAFPAFPAAPSAT